MAALESSFCLCPTGDSKGFTSRFFFSIAHDCIPVRVDGWQRELPFAAIAYPFAHLVDWRKVVVNVPLDDAHGLLEWLRDMPANELRERRLALRHAAPMLLYSGGEHETPPPAEQPRARAHADWGAAGHARAAHMAAHGAALPDAEAAFLDELERRFLPEHVPKNVPEGGEAATMQPNRRT
jgi:hypothetical protein